MQKTLVRFLGWEGPLEEGMATHSSILAWRIPMDSGAWWAMVHGVAESWTRLSLDSVDLTQSRLFLTKNSTHLLKIFYGLIYGL